jgi:PleD family two-component response regulator
MNKVIEVIEPDFLSQPTPDFSSSRSIGGSVMKERRRILIVDNDSDTTHLVKVLLERTGQYLVLEENDATRAHQSAQHFRPDLILLDVVMPETDGGEIAARIEIRPWIAQHANCISYGACDSSRGKEWSQYPRASNSCKARQHS